MTSYGPEIACTVWERIYSSTVQSPSCFCRYFPESDLDGDLGLTALQADHRSSLNSYARLSPLLVLLRNLVSDLRPDWQHLPPRWPRKQWEAPSPCASQPPVRSPKLFSHYDFGVSTHSFDIPLPSPPYRRYFITLLLLSLPQFVFNECVNRGMQQRCLGLILIQ